jgi:arylformamidase
MTRGKEVEMTRDQRSYDVSVRISKELAVPTGAPLPVVAPVMQVEEGYPFSIFMLTFFDHCGTHVDAPYHFEADGAKVDELALDVLIGRARVVEIATERVIQKADLLALDLDNVERLLLRTRNSLIVNSKEFTKNFVSVGADAAEFIVARGIKLVGIDYCSIEEITSKAIRPTTLSCEMVS